MLRICYIFYSRCGNKIYKMDRYHLRYLRLSKPKSSYCSQHFSFIYLQYQTMSCFNSAVIQIYSIYYAIKQSIIINISNPLIIQSSSFQHSQAIVVVVVVVVQLVVVVVIVIVIQLVYNNMQLSDIIRSHPHNDPLSILTSSSSISKPLSPYNSNYPQTNTQTDQDNGADGDTGEYDRPRYSNFSFCNDGENEHQSCQQLCSNCLAYQQERVTLQTVIESQGQQLQQKQRTIAAQEQQISQLKNQQQYLIHALEQLRDKNTNTDAEIEHRLEKMVRVKQDELNHADKEINKLKEWLKEEKIEVFRSIECIKIKDIIISNLEAELENYRLRDQQRAQRKIKKMEKANQEDEVRKYKAKLRQLQQHIQQLTQQIGKLRNSRREFAPRPSPQEPQTPILKLKVFSQNNRQPPLNATDTDTDYNMVTDRDNSMHFFLSQKCLQLEMEIQNLLFRIGKLTQQNKKLQDYKNSRNILERAQINSRQY